MPRFAAAAVAIFVLFFALSAQAQTVYPIDRAEILAGARFDFKVEFPGLADPAAIKVTLNGEDYAKTFGKAAAFVEREDGKEQSALILHDVVLAQPGTYRVLVSNGTTRRELTWTVYGTGPRKAKNVVLLIGDGMSPAHRVAARLLAKGIAEGKARGKLAMDDMPQMALVATAGSDSVITDSANSASAYATGHKSAVNAMGVYADRTIDPLAAKPDVLMGGGLANFLPKSAHGSKRKDETDFLEKFRASGYAVALTGPEMNALAAAPETKRLLGLFTLGNMDGALDRKFLKRGTVPKFPEQPDLTEQVRAALNVLARNEAGFFLMVESGMIDKYTHLLDMERAVYDTIMLDNVVRLVRDWSEPRGDTLILVVADHNHPIGLVGTIDDDMSKDAVAPLRERVRVYERAGFPNYPAPDAEGYPERVDVSRRLALFSASLPDHYETLRPKLDGPNDPTAPGTQEGTFVANERYKSVPGAALRLGNLPAMINADVHSGEDVILTATGPGSERVHGQMENTEVFRIIAEALGLGQARAAGSQ